VTDESETTPAEVGARGHDHRVCTSDVDATREEDRLVNELKVITCGATELDHAIDPCRTKSLLADGADAPMLGDLGERGRDRAERRHSAAAVVQASAGTGGDGSRNPAPAEVPQSDFSDAAAFVSVDAVAGDHQSGEEVGITFRHHGIGGDLECARARNSGGHVRDAVTHGRE